MNINKIFKEEYTQKVLKSGKTVVVDFYTDRCVLCKILSPVLEELEREKSDFVFFKINSKQSTQE